MNFKACTFERLLFISLGLVEALKSGKLLFWKWIYYGPSVDVGRIDLLFGTLQALGSHQNPRSLEEDEAFF